MKRDGEGIERKREHERKKNIEDDTVELEERIRILDDLDKVYQ